MSDTDGFDMVSFCPRRQSFIFSREDTAQKFIETFSTLLLLEPIIRVEQGSFLVAVEPVNEAFGE